MVTRQAVRDIRGLMDEHRIDCDLVEGHLEVAVLQRRVADLTGDGKAEIICAPLTGNAARVVAFDAASGNLVRNFTVAGAGSTNGFSIAAADLSAGTLTGTAVVDQVGTKNIATVSFTLADDKVAEGNEVMTLTVGGVSQSVTVVDSAAVWVTHAGVIRSVLFLRSHGHRTIASAQEWPQNAPAMGDWLALDLSP
mgnify:CR=1 FL=1